MNKKEGKTIDVGTLLRNHLKVNLIQGQTLANRIGRTGQTVTLYQKDPDMRVATLENICYALEHNFFQDLANHLPPDFTVNAHLNSGNSQLIAQLQEENKVLRIQNELLMKLRG